MSLRENLINHMKSRKITIPELSSTTGISVQTLKRLRSKSESNPTLEVLQKLSEGLGISLSDLIIDNKTYADHQISTNIDSSIDINDHIPDEFIVYITHEFFDLNPGTRAIFKKFTPGDKVTKYVIDRNGTILQLYKNENDEIQAISKKNGMVITDQTNIYACIKKEIYEVSYA